MRRFPGILILMGLLYSSFLPAQEKQTEIVIFPGTKIFPSLTADGMAHGMSIGRITENREWMGNIGGALPLIQAKAGGKTLQLGAAATAFSRIVKTPGHITVYTIDYKVDFPLDVRLDPAVLRLALGHVSSHFADDGIEILHEQSISYVRDYLTFAVACDIPLLGGYLYGGGDWNYHYEPVAGPWILQIGGEGGDIQLTDWARVFAAFDVKFRQNLAWGSTQSYQAGIRFFVKDHYALRFAYTFRTGFEERGQFFDRKVAMNIVSLFIDF